MKTALKIAGLVLVTALVLGNITLGHYVIAGSLVFGCVLPLCRSIGSDLGRRMAKRDIARIHAEVWGVK